MVGESALGEKCDECGTGDQEKGIGVAEETVNAEIEAGKEEGTKLATCDPTTTTIEYVMIGSTGLFHHFSHTYFKSRFLIFITRNQKLQQE